jgi:hypothetical protein
MEFPIFIGLLAFALANLAALGKYPSDADFVLNGRKFPSRDSTGREHMATHRARPKSLLPRN